MKFWIDGRNVEMDEFLVKKSLKRLEDEDVEGLDVIISSLEMHVILGFMRV